MKHKIFRLLLALVCLSGCATKFENEPLTKAEANEERRSLDVAHSDRPVILMSFSGGGVRATALSWAVLSDLATFDYKSKGETRSLIDDVSMVSSASGGSVTAAYFGLYGPQGLPSLESDFLARDNMGALLSDAANPFTWFDLKAIGSSRSTLVAEMFDDRLFHNKTFAELNKPGKPFVVLNATDMVSGEIFPFTPGRFDDICSDFDKLPVSIGVASSAAVPVALSPLAFKNYSVTHCQGRTTPQWIKTQLEEPYAAYSNIERYKRARYANDLRRGPDPFRDIQYLYLVDGGLADNLGLHSIHEAVTSSNGMGELLYHINEGNIRKLVVIVVNSRSDAPNPIYESPDRPGVFGMIGSVASVPIDSTTSGTNAQMESLLAEIKAAASVHENDAKFEGMKVYGIQIDFDQLPSSTEAERTLRDKAKAIPTSWTMSEENRNIIKEVGPELLRNHPCFQHLLMDMKIKAPFVNKDFAHNECPIE